MTFWAIWAGSPWEPRTAVRTYVRTSGPIQKIIVRWNTQKHMFRKLKPLKENPFRRSRNPVWSCLVKSKSRGVVMQTNKIIWTWDQWPNYIWMQIIWHQQLTHKTMWHHFVDWNLSIFQHPLHRDSHQFQNSMQRRLTRWQQHQAQEKNRSRSSTPMATSSPSLRSRHWQWVTPSSP